jgi:hypothetical protein
MTSLPAFVDWVFAQQVDPAEQRNAAGESARDTSTRVTFSTRDCQFYARKRVAATCTRIATRARNSRAETGGESVTIWAAVPLSRVVALFGKFALPNN